MACVAWIIYFHNSNSADGSIACSIVFVDWQEEDKMMIPKRWHNSGIYSFFKNLGYVGDMKEGLYWGHTVLERPVNRTVVWHFLFGTCLVIHIFRHVCKIVKCEY